ncbi:MAG: hypothetical protein ACK4V6_11045 [Microthrixaceae bacterium]
MSTTITIPTPPSWIDIDAVVSPDLRRHTFELIEMFRAAAGDTLSVEQLEDARTTLRALDDVESPFLTDIETDGLENELGVADGMMAIVSSYSGSLAAHNAMGDYVQRCTRIDLDRYHPEEFMRPAVIAAES